LHSYHKKEELTFIITGRQIIDSTADKVGTITHNAKKQDHYFKAADSNSAKKEETRF
jgi:hypothetical protein